MEERLVQLSFSAAFDRVSRCGLLYKLRSIGVREQLLSIVRSSLVIERSTCVWMVKARFGRKGSILVSECETVEGRVKHDIFQMRKQEEMFNKLICNHLRHDNNKFQDFIRVTIKQFDFLVGLI